MLDSIRKRREKIKEVEDKKETNNNKNNTETSKKVDNETDLKTRDELAIGVDEHDDLDRELIGEDEGPKTKEKSPPKSKTGSLKKVERQKKSGSSERKTSKKISAD